MEEKKKREGAVGWKAERGKQPPGNYPPEQIGRHSNVWEENVFFWQKPRRNSSIPAKLTPVQILPNECALNFVQSFSGWTKTSDTFDRPSGEAARWKWPRTPSRVKCPTSRKTAFDRGRSFYIEQNNSIDSPWDEIYLTEIKHGPYALILRLAKPTNFAFANVKTWNFLHLWPCDSRQKLKTVIKIKVSRFQTIKITITYVLSGGS